MTTTTTMTPADLLEDSGGTLANAEEGNAGLDFETQRERLHVAATTLALQSIAASLIEITKHLETIANPMVATHDRTADVHFAHEHLTKLAKTLTTSDRSGTIMGSPPEVRPKSDDQGTDHKR